MLWLLIRRCRLLLCYANMPTILLKFTQKKKKFFKLREQFEIDYSASISQNENLNMVDMAMNHVGPCKWSVPVKSLGTTITSLLTTLNKQIGSHALISFFFIFMRRFSRSEKKIVLKIYSGAYHFFYKQMLCGFSWLSFFSIYLFIFIYTYWFARRSGLKIQ